MRIGLSGLLLWTGLVSVTLAAPAPEGTPEDAKKSERKQSLGTIRDPFNPQPYMMEMAAKMDASNSSNAVLGQTSLQRSLNANTSAGPTAGSSSRTTWLSPAPSRPSNEATVAPPAYGRSTWVSSGNPVTQRPLTNSSTNEGLTVWSPIRDRSQAGASQSGTTKVRMLQPDGGTASWPQSNTTTQSQTQLGWRSLGGSATANPPAASTTQSPAAQLFGTQQGTAPTGWRPSTPQTSAAPTNAQTPTPQARQLTPAPQTAQPMTSTESTVQPAGQRPSVVTPAPDATESEAEAEEATSVTLLSPGAVQGTMAAPEAPVTGWRPTPNVVAAQPERKMRHTTWLKPAAPAARVGQAPATTTSIPTPTSTPTESSMRYTTVLTPPQAAQQPTAPVIASQTPQPSVSTPATPQTTMDQESWLATDNRAAQIALEKIRSRKSGVTTTTAVAADSPLGEGPDLTPRSADSQSPFTASQMALLGGTVNPQMALAASDPAAYAATDLSSARHFYEEEPQPWSLASDLDKYREHALQEGSRDFGESLGKALQRIGLAVEDTTNIITLGYASDRGQPFRTNDGKGLFEEPGRVPQQAGATIGSFGSGLYSVADLVMLNGLPDGEEPVYKDNHPIVRPFIFTGRTIGGAWKTTEEIGNAVTWGYFDNVTGTVGMVIEDLIEMLKHTGQAVTNLARVPVHLLGGKDKGADKALDWVLLVPLEFASNVVEMKGIANMDDYKTAFADKGVIGSILELGGSTYIVYRAVDKLADELKDDGGNRHRGNNTPEPEPEVPVEVPDTPNPPGTWTDYLFGSDGVTTGTRTP